MKIAVLILSMLILQTKASFYDDITGAMSSVEDAFGKLLNDVVTDVKNTVHCTILAMEQVLVISGAATETTTSNNECQDRLGVDDRNYKIPIDEFKEKDKYYKEYSNKDISEQIHSSISKVNETLMSVFDNDGHERLKDIRKMLKNETDRLTEVSHLLRQELDKISHRLKHEFLNMDDNKKSMESLWDDMKILHEAEMKDKNISEVNEIGEVLNEAMDVLNLNSKDIKSDEDKMKVIMRELQQETQKNNVTLNSAPNNLPAWDEELSKMQNFSAYETSKEIPETFKDVERILKQKDKSSKEMQNDKVNDADTKIQDKTTYSEEYQHEQVAPSSQDYDFDLDRALGGLATEDREKAIDNAKDIIKDSANADSILDNFFSNQADNSEFDDSVFYDEDEKSEIG